MNLAALTLAATALLPSGQDAALSLVYDLGPTGREEAQTDFLEPLRLRAKRLEMDPLALALDGVGRLVVRARPADLAAWTDLVERRGRLEFVAVAEKADFPAGVLEAERAALEAVIAARPDLDPALYRSARAEAAGIRWAAQETREGRELVPLLVDTNPDRRFATADLLELEATTDEAGFPAMAGRVARPDDFGDFTESMRDRKMAVVLDGEVLVAPVVMDRLPGEFVISFGPRDPIESERLLPLMLSGELPRVPVLVEIVGR